MGKFSYEISHAPFDLNILSDSLNKLNVKRSNSVVITEFDNKIVSKYNCSEKYGELDFSQFSRSIINEITDIVEPDFMTLRFRQGFQELRLMGKEINIRDEIFFPTLSIFNSTNGLSKFLVGIGLIRHICSNGMMLGIEGKSLKVECRHYKQVLQDKKEEIIKELPKMKIAIPEYVTLIQKMNESDISLQKFMQNILKTGNNPDKEYQYLLQNIKRFGKMLINSKTDSINPMIYNESQLDFIENSMKYLHQNEKVADIVLDKYTIFNCYLEVFNKSNTGIISKESDRVMKALELV